MTNTKILFFAFLIILFSLPFIKTIAQIGDFGTQDPMHAGQDRNKLAPSPDTARVYYFFGSIDSLSLAKLYHVDTSLNYFQQYDASKKNYKYYVGRGNIGLHSKNLIFEPILTEGFNYVHSFLDLYTYKNEEVMYYKSRKPYTELFYATGASKEQTVEVLHSQEIKPRLTVGIKFRFLNSKGAYTNQQSDNKNLYMTMRWATKDKRYGIIANYRRNKFVSEENGGIQNEEHFTTNAYPIRDQMPVNLSNAKNTSVTSGVFFNHYFNIGKPVKKTIDINNIVIDTARLDSIPIAVDTSNVMIEKRKGFKFGRLTHSLLLERSKIYYEDANASNSFYTPFDTPLTTSGFFDSTYVYNLENEFKWTNLDVSNKPEDKKIYFYLGLKHKLAKVNDTIQKSSFNQIIPKAGFSLLLFKKSRFNADGYFVIGDYNKGDVGLFTELIQPLNFKNRNWGNIRFIANYVQRSPDWFYTYYRGNVLQWDNQEFAKEKIIQLGINYSYKNLIINTRFNHIKNFVYFDQTAHPEQHQNSVSIINANVRYAYQLRKWKAEIDLTYQKGVNGVINLPELTANFILTYTKQIQNIAKLQPGIEVFYNTPYFADSYMPAIRSFYIQNTKKLGNHFYGDVFLNVIIKRTIFFIKYSHINSRMKFDYFMTPGYPMQDIALKFGLNWKFYD